MIRVGATDTGKLSRNSSVQNRFSHWHFPSIANNSNLTLMKVLYEIRTHKTRIFTVHHFFFSIYKLDFICIHVYSSIKHLQICLNKRHLFNVWLSTQVLIAKLASAENNYNNLGNLSMVTGIIQLIAPTISTRRLLN